MDGCAEDLFEDRQEVVEGTDRLEQGGFRALWMDMGEMDMSEMPDAGFACVYRGDDADKHLGRRLIENQTDDPTSDFQHRPGRDLLRELWTHKRFDRHDRGVAG